jgi:hypothetical protein
MARQDCDAVVRLLCHGGALIAEICESFGEENWGISALAEGSHPVGWPSQPGHDVTGLAQDADVTLTLALPTTTVSPHPVHRGRNGVYFFHYLPLQMEHGQNDSPGTFGMFTVRFAGASPSHDSEARSTSGILRRPALSHTRRTQPNAL